LKGLLKKAYEEKQKVVERERKEAKYLNEIETADRIAKEKRRLHDEKFPVMKPEEEVRKGKRYVDGIARSAEAWKRIREGCAREDDWEWVNIREEDETKIKQLMGEVKKSPEGRVTSRRIPKSKCSSTISSSSDIEPPNKFKRRAIGAGNPGGTATKPMGREEADLLGDVEFNAFIRASGKELV
ncbi:hypothetical protein ADUPG1_003072, partial [Aduncisulcus paluster]